MNFLGLSKNRIPKYPVINHYNDYDAYEYGDLGHTPFSDINGILKCQQTYVRSVIIISPLKPPTLAPVTDHLPSLRQATLWSSLQGGRRYFTGRRARPRKANRFGNAAAAAEVAQDHPIDSRLFFICSLCSFEVGSPMSHWLIRTK